MEPIRLAEEIRHWKRQERENAVQLRLSGGFGASPAWLAAWEGAFGAAEAAAAQLLSAGNEGWRGGDASLRELKALAAGAAEQSRQWAAALRELSRFTGGAGPAEHMARDSEYFLAVLDAAAEARTLPEGTWSALFASSAGTPPGTPETAPNAVPIGGHTLPPLPYAYDALEPYLDAETVRIHHAILHNNYVLGLNTAEQKLAEARATGDFDLVKHWERELAFNGAGHYLHTVYFYGMKPNGGGLPSGELAAQLDRDFGGFEAFKRHFSQAAEKVEGSGWAILVWSPRSGRLQILQAEKHQNLTQWDDVPLLAIDVWEHSYYLLYKNERAKYIDAWFHIVNWPYAAERFLAARHLKWKPY